MEKLIVSMTTYPDRIHRISRVLDSICRQTYKPDKIALYLSEDQFPDRKIPVDLSVFAAHGLEIYWCRGDMKSHKKYLYALENFQDDYIITVDDDFYYEKHMIEELIQNIHKFPKCILARRTHLITATRNGSISSYENWWGECIHYMEEPRMDLCAIGCGGILYPPHTLHHEVFHIDNIKKYCMYADDMWLKVMELISDVPVVQVATRFMDIIDIGSIKDGLYQKHNGNGGNDRQLQKLLEIYGSFGRLELSLAEKIFSTGILYEDEVEAGEHMDNRKLVETWLEEIGSDKNIVIYGAGSVAKSVHSLLVRYQKKENLKAFVVEDTSINVSEIDHIRVVSYLEAAYEDTVCLIALSDLEKQFAICQKLLSIGLEEKQIVFMNQKLQCAVRDILKDGV